MIEYPDGQASTYIAESRLWTPSLSVLMQKRVFAGYAVNSRLHIPYESRGVPYGSWGTLRTLTIYQPPGFQLDQTLQQMTAKLRVRLWAAPSGTSDPVLRLHSPAKGVSGNAVAPQGIAKQTLLTLDGGLFEAGDYMTIEIQGKENQNTIGGTVTLWTPESHTLEDDGPEYGVKLWIA